MANELHIQFAVQGEYEKICMDLDKGEYNMEVKFLRTFRIHLLYLFKMIKYSYNICTVP